MTRRSRGLLADLLRSDEGATAALVGLDGASIRLSPQVHRALVQVVEAMAHDMGMTVAPHNAMLTTRRPRTSWGSPGRSSTVATLQRSARGRHRFVALQDLIAYQQRVSLKHRDALDQMAHNAQKADLYAATDGLPHCSGTDKRPVDS